MCRVQIWSCLYLCANINRNWLCGFKILVYLAQHRCLTARRSSVWVPVLSFLTFLFLTLASSFWIHMPPHVLCPRVLSSVHSRALACHSIDTNSCTQRYSCCSLFNRTLNGAEPHLEKKREQTQQKRHDSSSAHSLHSALKYVAPQRPRPQSLSSILYIVCLLTLTFAYCRLNKDMPSCILFNLTAPQREKTRAGRWGRVRVGGWRGFTDVQAYLGFETLIRCTERWLMGFSERHGEGRVGCALQSACICSSHCSAERKIITDTEPSWRVFPTVAAGMEEVSHFKKKKKKGMKGKVWCQGLQERISRLDPDVLEFRFVCCLCQMFILSWHVF